MTRPNQHQTQHQHKTQKGPCKVCGHVTKAGIMIGPTTLNKQHQGDKIYLCTPCGKKKHAGKTFTKMAIEALGMKDWSQNTPTNKLARRIKQ